MKAISVLISAILCLLLAPSEIEGVRFRCGVFSFFGRDRACRLSCWVQGHSSGSCDEDQNCNCSEVDLDIGAKIEDVLGGLSIGDYVEKQYNKFVDEVESWGISESVKSLVPSRCRIGNGFCESSCQTIGRVSGKCNSDYSDCDCSDEIVTPKQYALCVEDGICSLYCQSRDYARGECQGETNWDCKCISLKGEDITTEYDATLDIDLKTDDDKVEFVEDFSR